MSDFWNHTRIYWTSGGALLIPIAVVCLGIWGYFLRSRDRMCSLVRESRELEEQVATHGLDPLPEQGRLATWLRRIADDIRGGASPRTAFHLRTDECMEQLRRDIIVLGALTAVAPLLGLLGTVRGMIETFSAVARVAGNTGVEVADGISQALITTQFGLVVAVPGVFGIARLRALLLEVEARIGSLRATALTRIEAPAIEDAV